jgi:integrase
MPLDRIGVAEVDAFRRRLVREGKLGARSINRLLDVLSAVIEEALDQEVIVGRNPARGRRRRLPVERPRRAYLDRAEHIEALLDAAGDLDREHPGVYRRAAIATLVFAGLRIGELADLRWSDVHLGSGRLHVRSAKTAAGERTVELLPVLRDELAALAADRRGDDLAAYVFGTSRGGRLQRSNFTRRVLRLAVERANGRLADRDAEPLPEGITPHSLRRTYASLLYAVGEAAPYVMAQMGHTDPSLALAIYAKAMDRRAGEPERLAALVGRVTTGDKALESVGRGTESERMSA